MKTKFNLVSPVEVDYDDTLFYDMCNQWDDPMDFIRPNRAELIENAPHYVTINSIECDRVPPYLLPDIHLMAAQHIVEQLIEKFER